MCTSSVEHGQGRPSSYRRLRTGSRFLQTVYTVRGCELLALARSMETAKPRILVVEDEAAIRDGLTDVLVYHGYRVDAVGDGRDGLAEGAERPVRLAAARRDAAGARRLFDLRRGAQGRPRSAHHHADGQDERRGHRQRPGARRRRLHRETVLDRAARAARQGRAAPLEDGCGGRGADQARRRCRDRRPKSLGQARHRASDVHAPRDGDPRVLAAQYAAARVARRAADSRLGLRPVGRDRNAHGRHPCREAAAQDRGGREGAAQLAHGARRRVTGSW